MNLVIGSEESKTLEVGVPLQEVIAAPAIVWQDASPDRVLM